MATWVLSRRWVARYTAAKPPLPSRRSIRYLSMIAPRGSVSSWGRRLAVRGARGGATSLLREAAARDTPLGTPADARDGTRDAGDGCDDGDPAAAGSTRARGGR